MVYNHGSRPANDYDYICFVKHIAPVLPKNDSVFSHRNSLRWRENLNEIPFTLFKNICHWKSQRPFNNVLNNTERNVNRQWHNALQHLNEPPFQGEAIKGALEELIELNGVEVRTASALLTAWNPCQFGIMDFKTLAVLNMPESYSATSYVAFRNRLLELKNAHSELHNCALRQIELALWHYYPIQEVGQTERQDT